LRNDVNPAIDEVIEKAIAPKPQDRFQSADEMTTAIRAALIEDEKKTVVAGEDVPDRKEIIEVKSSANFDKDKKLKRYLLFGIFSGLIIIVVISLLIWLLR
jgi:Uma2 family endonuclease